MSTTKTKTAKATTNGKQTDPLTPEQLAAEVARTVRRWFPHCDGASVVVQPSPGLGPVELVCSGRGAMTDSLGDEFTWEHGSKWQAVDHQPDDEGK